MFLPSLFSPSGELVRSNSWPKTKGQLNSPVYRNVLLGVLFWSYVSYGNSNEKEFNSGSQEFSEIWGPVQNFLKQKQ